MSQVTVFSADTCALTYTDKKGNLHGITIEGALWKGGAALAEAKDLSLASALTKASNGRYRAAADVFAVAFPKAAKAAEAVNGTTPSWANKRAFEVLLAAVSNQRPKEGKDFTAKQIKAIDLLRAINRLPQFEVAAEAGEVVAETAAH